MPRITSLAVVRADTHKVIEISCLTKTKLIDKCRRHNHRNLTKVAIAKVAYDLEVGPAFGQRKITNLTVVSVLEYSL